MGGKLNSYRINQYDSDKSDNTKHTGLYPPLHVYRKHYSSICLNITIDELQGNIVCQLKAWPVNCPFNPGFPLTETHLKREQ